MKDELWSIDYGALNSGLWGSGGWGYEAMKDGLWGTGEWVYEVVLEDWP